MRRAGWWELSAFVAVSCSDPATQPSSRLRPVSLALAVQIGPLGNTLRVNISYQRSGNSNASVSLLDQTIVVGVQARAVPFVVDIAPCLSDPLREGVSLDGPPACVLHIAVTLLDASQQQVDQSTLPPLTVHAGDNAQASLAVGTHTSYLSLAPGLDFTCRAVTVTGGGTSCWGSNRVSQLGKAPFQDFLEISAGSSFTCGRTRAGEAWCWGDNAAGELGDNLASSRATPTLVKSPVPFTQVVTGLDFACGLAETGTAYCWGENAWASLGDGTKLRHAVPAPVKGGFRFVRLGAGGHAVCGLTDGTVYCWGSFGSNVPTDALAAAWTRHAGGDRRRRRRVIRARNESRVRHRRRRIGGVLRHERQRPARRRNDDGSHERAGARERRTPFHFSNSRKSVHLRAGDGRLRVLLGLERVWAARHREQRRESHVADARLW